MQSASEGSVSQSPTPSFPSAQSSPARRSSEKQRISVAVELAHVGHIKGCLAGIPHADFTVSPIISGWGVRGYWSSEHNFARIGEKVLVRFTADTEPIRPLIAAGFGILGSKVLQIHVSDPGLRTQKSAAVSSDA